MKKLTCFSLFILATLASAQNRFPPINIYTGNPTGVACSIPNALVQSSTTGAISSCTGGVWVTPAGGGGACSPNTIANGCTGATTAAGALVNLGIGIISAANLTGADTCAAITTYLAAQATAGNSASVFIPPGTYSCSNTLTIPVKAGKTYFVSAQPNTVVISYTGSTVAVSSTISGSIQDIMSGMMGITIDGTSSTGTAGGIALSGYYGGYYQNVEVKNFTSGDGWLFQGGNVTCLNCRSVGNKNDVHLLGTTISSVNFAPNGIHWIGGQIGNAVQWGWWDDFAGHTASGQSYNNSVEDAEFVGNGTGATSTSGHMFLEGSSTMVVKGNYFGSLAGLENIRLGTGSTYTVTGVKIATNHFETPATTSAGPVPATVDAQFGTFATDVNVELGPNALFIKNTSNSAGVSVEDTYPGTLVSGTPANLTVVTHAGLVALHGTFSGSVTVSGLLTGHLGATFDGLNGSTNVIKFQPATDIAGYLEVGGLNSTAAAYVWNIDQVGNASFLAYSVGTHTVLPSTLAGYQGPSAGYVQLGPSATGTPGCLYDNGSGTRSWAACSGGTGTGFNGGAGTSFQDALEIAAPANPASTYDRLYLDSTAHQLKCLTSSGGSCMPSGSMTYPGAGIPVSTGSAWGTSLTAPAGTIVGTSDTQTLTNKTLDGVTPTTMAYVDPTSSIQTQLNGKQATLTNPVTGPGSGATVGHLAVMNATSGDVIADGGAVPAAQVAANLASSGATGVTGQLPIGQVGSAGLSASNGVVIASTGAISLTYGTTANTVAQGNDSRITGAVPNTTTVNGHALSSNVTVSASDLTTGTLPHAQLPALLSGDIPNNAANTTGTAANLSGTPALPNGTTATTQTAGDNSTKLATTAYVATAVTNGAYTLPSQYKTWSCQPGLGDGLNAITAGTYLQTTCKNTTGVSITLTGLQCYVDGGSSSTMNAAGNTLGALLTGAVTCSTSFVAGTQSANVTLTNGDYIKFTFVADGTAKQTTWVVTGTY